MFHKCYNCSNNLSLSWFLGAFHWTKHRCVTCGELHEFTYLRAIYTGLTAAGIVIISPLLDGVISSQIVRFFLVGSILSLVLSVIPGQHKLISKTNTGGK